jgi:hypothetical protein
VNADQIFGSVFDELLSPEVPNPVYFWQPIGAIGGAALGFIIFNIPGCIAGYYFGSNAGRVRDMKGVSVVEAFSNLSHSKKAEILAHLAKRFLATSLTS